MREGGEEQAPLLSRAEALGLGRDRSGAGAAVPEPGTGWRHACHVLLHAPLPAGAPPPGHAVLMQLRFDGRFGFPGGLAEPGEPLEAALERELREELGPAAAALRLRPRHHRGARAWPRGGAGSDGGLVTHLYVRRLRLDELEALERGGARAPEHGLEVQGLVRVPLGVGLPAFLQNRFAGDAREQLLGALPALGVQPPPARDPAGAPPEPGEPLTPTPAAGEEGNEPVE
ncbi:U8 snoRNA-decapping enzyme-like isoform X1 [Corvus moneduloides]|uniref:U8 snoRNA-decapping enzyme-like isoform X1 n=1 Tax=Corvus moneduloides TaxID=1196302 RepID=UPI0013646283|nr:U8 snoRNA-decapping enzyme-like isoform X1 [Corvus moneduloides]